MLWSLARARERAYAKLVRAHLDGRDVAYAERKLGEASAAVREYLTDRFAFPGSELTDAVLRDVTETRIVLRVATDDAEYEVTIGAAFGTTQITVMRVDDDPVADRIRILFGEELT
jgi:phage gp36-like protein